MEEIKDIRFDNHELAKEMFTLAEDLFPICRSITGNGVRQSLERLKEVIPLEIQEVPTGTQAFDWTIPKEWNITDAWIKGPNGEKIIDFNDSNIHILNYSTPINQKMPLSELKEHLFSTEENPEWIPYRTSYYKENWGFCISDYQLEDLEDGEYEVLIDSSLEDGSLSYGEFFVKGSSEKEILLTCYTCHPSIANDGLSGIVLLTYLAGELMNADNLKYSYRFLFIPETIGSITWLSRNEDKLANIQCGLVATCVGDGGHFTYKKTRGGNASIDRIVDQVLKKTGWFYQLEDFHPFGSDERQFCSPAFNLQVGSLMNTMYGNYEEYHTSGDNLDLISGEGLSRSLWICLKVIAELENRINYESLNPKGEPQLGKRDLYRNIGLPKGEEIEEAFFWIMAYGDGSYALSDIVWMSKLSLDLVTKAAEVLEKKELIRFLDYPKN